METINYNKINKKKNSNAGIYAFSSFLILSVGVITYFIINEPTPKVIGSDPSKIVAQDAAMKLEEESKKQLKSEVTTKNEKDVNSKTVTANINFPKIVVENNEFVELNNEIEEAIRKRYVPLKEEMEKNAEHTYEFTSNFRNYENMIGEKQVLSIIVTNKMMENQSKLTSLLETVTYNINLKTREKEKSEHIALEIYGKDCKEKISNVVNSYLIDKKIKKAEDATYVYTGLENYYVEDGEMHLVLNPTDIGTKDFGAVDIKIGK